jgi:UTP--glucose-1-phosphate uridylyltransferase
MLTVVDRPLIQYAVEEALEAGIEQMIFVTGRGKTALEDHFDIAYELEATMRGRGKSLERAGATGFQPVRRFRPSAGAARLGHAVWCARHIVGGRALRVLLPDDYGGKPGCLAMVEAMRRSAANVVRQEVPPRAHWGLRISRPARATAPHRVRAGREARPATRLQPGSSAATSSSPSDASRQQENGAGGEIQLTDAMAKLIGASRSTASPSRANATTAATRSASSAPTSLWP